MVRKIHELPTYKPDEEFGYFFEEPVQIVSARIIEASAEAEKKKLDEAGAAHRKPINPRTVEVVEEQSGDQALL